VTVSAPPPVLSEAEFQRALIDRFKECGYLVNRVYRLRTQSGAWLTSTTLKGLPDLMAVGRSCTVWTEVKSAVGAVSAEQLVVLDAFAEIETNRCWLVRPTDDLQAIANWIQDPLSAPRRFGFDAGTLGAALRTKSGKTTRR